MEFARAIEPSPENFLPYDYCIFVLGNTGNGKSTFINTFINVALNKEPGNFITAIESKEYPAVDLDFSIDPIREGPPLGKSQTLSVHYYKISTNFTNYKTILLVDTPGLGAPEGVEKDDDFVDSILDSAIKIPKINAIIVIEKHSTNRLAPTLEYALYRLCEVIPNAFENKVILALSFDSGGPSNFLDEWFPFKHELKVSMNNVCFKYSNEVYLNDRKIAKKFKKKINKSREVIQQIFDKVINMDSQETSIYLQLFKEHNKIMKRISSFTIILENIDRICESITDSSFEINNANTMVWKRTKHHNTICVEHHTLCHENCDLNFKSTDGSKYFDNCYCMFQFCICLDKGSCKCIRNKKLCRICGCSSEQHVHRHKKPVMLAQTIEEIFNDMCISYTTKDPKIVLMKLREKKKEVLEKLLENEKTMMIICKNYKISRYFKLALNHQKYYRDPKNQAISNQKGVTLTKVYEELSKINPENK
ncbi:hypothetical protein SteCoe_33344 [Stentor coeruleus]|uniref:G domain-containing protein n=1 Tax=Stentor coeruleus TaxID=5963 RepID=A0A1R2AWZ2_9CILI|nr:hypothetical protein SteCoe_33344 [Stentor coeruleus]